VYRLRKFAQRNRAAALTAAAVLLALAGGTVETTLGMIQAGRAKREADAAREQAERERDAAVAARKETFEALGDLTDSTVGDLLSHHAAASPAEREFFGRVVARYERLAAALPDAAEAQTMRARCLRQVGHAYSYLGLHDQALDAYRRAADLYRALLARSPDDPAAAGMLIACLTSISVTYSRLGRPGDRNRTQDEALALAEGSHRRSPDDGFITLGLAVLCANRGVRRWGDRTARLADVNRAIGLLEAEVGRGRKGHADLANALATRAAHFADLGDVEGARADAARVGQLARAANTTHLRLCQCRCLRHLAHALSKANRPEAAAAACRESAAGLERLAAGRPGSADIRAELKRSYDELQSALRKAGRGEEADRYQRQALALLERDTQSGRESAALSWELAVRAADQARSATAAGRTGEADEALGRAVRYARRALDLSPPGPADTPAGRADLRQLAWRCRAVGYAAEKAGKWPEAIEFGRRQLELARAASAPGGRPDPDLFNLLLRGNWSLAVVLAAAGRADQARSAWEEMVRLEAWSNSGSENDGACRDIGKIGAQLAAAGQPADVAAVLAPGLAERRARLAADPTAPGAREELRRAYRTLGLIHEYAGRYQAALEAFDQAVAVGPVPKGAPAGVQRETYTNLLTGRAVCLDALGREAEATAAWEAHRAFTGVSRVRSTFRAIRLAGYGQPERGVRLAEEKLRESAGGGDRYDAACVYATASASAALTPARREELARRAVALLGEARAAGFFDDPKQVAHAKADGDLDAIRGREDFKKLLAALEAATTKESE
jgi:tetratricopeptide (TPR) repeat protein